MLILFRPDEERLQRASVPPTILRHDCKAMSAEAVTAKTAG